MTEQLSPPLALKKEESLNLGGMMAWDFDSPHIYVLLAKLKISPTRKLQKHQNIHVHALPTWAYTSQGEKIY